MAKSLSVLMFVFAVVSFMSHTIFSHDYDDYPDENPDYIFPPISDYIPEPVPAYKPYYTPAEFAFQEGCFEKLKTDCRGKILMDMEDETTTPLTIECCRYLLKFGRDCHLVVAKFMSIYQAGYPPTTKAVAKSKHTWKDCVRRVESYIEAPQQSQEFDRYPLAVPEDVNISPTPDLDIHDPHDPPIYEADPPAYKSHFTPAELAFEDFCYRKLNTDCRGKILTDLEDETTTPLTIECCRYLLKFGRDCHLVVAKFMSIYDDYGYTPRTKAVAKSKYTWKDCVRRVESHIGAPISLE